MSSAPFPPDLEEMRSETQSTTVKESKKGSIRSSMLSKFLTDASQPKVPGGGGAIAQDASPMMRPFDEKPSPIPKTSRVSNQNSHQESLLTKQLRLASNQPSATSLFTQTG